MNHKNASTELIEVDDEPQLSPVQQRVLSAIMAGRTYVEAASEAGITDRTIRRWRESCPAFEHALRSQIQAIRDSSAVGATIAIQSAIKTLASIASDPGHPQALKAIKMILDLHGPLQPVSKSAGIDQVSQELTFAKFQRCAGMLN